MKNNKLSKLGKSILVMELGRNPFSEPIRSIESVNETFDLLKKFSPKNEIVQLENGLYETKRFFCWHTFLGLCRIPFPETMSFLDAISEMKEEEIAHMGIMPTHLVCRTIVSKSTPGFGWHKEDTVDYKVYYLHPYQREAIDFNVPFINKHLKYLNIEPNLAYKIRG